jgi:hypothetical protein
MSYLTIKEAVQYTGKSESTLRKLARENKGSKHKGVRFEKLKTGHEKILFAIDFLNSCFNSSNNNQTTTLEATTLSILHEQLKAKDVQISDLNERLKEAHILVNNLENKLSIALPPPPTPKPKKRKFLFWRR